MTDVVSVVTELSDAKAWSLAQLVKRIGWREVRINAVDDEEAYLMMDALAVLQKDLAELGYEPR